MKLPISVLLFILLIMVGPLVAVSATADSDGGGICFLLFLGFFLIFIPTCFWCSFAIPRALNKGRTSLKRIGQSLAVVVIVTVAAAGLRYRQLHPSHIAYEFEYGQTGGWQAVQFSEPDGQGGQIEGPWVGGYPLSVSFPDLNGDGHRDIRVKGGGGMLAEFEALPVPQGDKRWRYVRGSGFRMHYLPEGLRYGHSSPNQKHGGNDLCWSNLWLGDSGRISPPLLGQLSGGRAGL